MFRVVGRTGTNVLPLPRQHFCTFCAAAEQWFYIFFNLFILGTFYFVFCTQFDGIVHTAMKEPLHNIVINILRVSCRIYTSRFMHNTYISFTFPLVFQSSYSILLPALGPLHLRIPRFPLELLVRDPLVEDRPATV